MSVEMKDSRMIKVFLDDEQVPFVELYPPASFMLDTTKIPDGKHRLRIVARSGAGAEGIRILPFEVRNGPAISIEGIGEHEVVNAFVPVTINSYGSEQKERFVVTGSENPKAVPAWVWALLIGFAAFAAFYLILYWTPEWYRS